MNGVPLAIASLGTIWPEYSGVVFCGRLGTCPVDEWKKTLTTTHHAILPHPHVIIHLMKGMHCFLSYYNVTQMTICAEKWRRATIYYYIYFGFTDVSQYSSTNSIVHCRLRLFSPVSMANVEMLNYYLLQFNLLIWNFFCPRWLELVFYQLNIGGFLHWLKIPGRYQDKTREITLQKPTVQK